jgi:type II secretory pathway component PulJ
MKKVRKMKKRPGNTLLEVLIALGVLGVIVPTSLDAFGTAFSAELRIHQRADKASYAEWWFNQLEFPVSPADIDAAPRRDALGKMRFEWETKPLANDALQVTLRVSNGSPADAVFTAIRVY